MQLHAFRASSGSNGVKCGYACYIKTQCPQRHAWLVSHAVPWACERLSWTIIQVMSHGSAMQEVAVIHVA